MKTFKHYFGHGVSCRIQIADEPPPKGETHVLKVEWLGLPTKGVMKPYIAWMNSINMSLAGEWGVKLMHVFMTSADHGEVWIYEPNQPAKLAQRY